MCSPFLSRLTRLFLFAFISISLVGCQEWVNLTGVPTLKSAAPALDITVSASIYGSNVTHYTYLFGRSSDVNCDPIENYPSPIPLTQKITNLTSLFPDGELTLCVVGISYQSGTPIFDSRRKIARWKRDTQAPVVSISSPVQYSKVKGYATIQGSCEAPALQQTSAENVILTGDIESSVSVICSTAGTYETPIVFTNPNAAGVRQIKVKQTDLAGFQSEKTYQFLNSPFFTLEYPLETDTVSPRFTVRGSCKSDLPFTLETGLTILGNVSCLNDHYSVEIQGSVTGGTDVLTVRQGTYEYVRPVKIQNVLTPLNEKSLIVYNTNAKDAFEIAEYYRASRGMATSHLCAVQMPSGNFASAAQLLGARKTVVEQCICPLIPVDTRPSPCSIANVDAIAAVSPISHMVLIRGIPSRLYGTGWTTDSQGPSLDLYFSHLLYKASSEVFGPGKDGSLNYPSYSSVTYVPSYMSNLPPLSPATDKMVAYGRIDGLSKDSAKAMIDRTLIAEREGIDGNFVYGFNGNLYEQNIGNILRDVTDTQHPACTNYLTSGGTWPIESCRAGGLVNDVIPGSETSSIPVAKNLSLYLNLGVPANQIGFEGNFSKMLKFHKSETTCVELCADFSDPQLVAECRNHSTDYFKEINTDCVGVAKGFMGFQLRSYSVQFFGIYPQGWMSSANGGLTEKSAPTTKTGDAYHDSEFTDDTYLRFGDTATSYSATCISETGVSSACPEKVAVSLDKVFEFTPSLSTNTDQSFQASFWYRNPSMPSGAVTVQVVAYSSSGTVLNLTPETISMVGAHSNWTQYSGTHTVPALQLSNIKKVELRIRSQYGLKLSHYFDLDAVKFTHINTNQSLIATDVGSFSLPYVNNLVDGDWATNAIERLGGIGWWGSNSHHQTGGTAFMGTDGFASAFFSGRSLGESVYVAGNQPSGMIYGDPLYTSVASKIYVDDPSVKMFTPYSGPVIEKYLGYSFSRLYPQSLTKKIKLNVLSGKNQALTTRWQVDRCAAGNSPIQCDINNGWNKLYEGQGAGENIALPLADVTSLIADPKQNEDIFLRLKVWNLGEESKALYSKFYLNYEGASDLSTYLGEVKLGDYSLQSSDLTPIAREGINQIKVQWNDPASIATVRVDLFGARLNQYATELVNYNPETGLAVYSITPSIVDSEKTLLRISKDGEASTYRANILPGNISQESNEEPFIVDSIDLDFMNLIIAFFAAHPEEISPEILSLVDFNSDGQLSALDADYIQSKIDAGKTMLPEGEPIATP